MTELARLRLDIDPGPAKDSAGRFVRAGDRVIGSAQRQTRGVKQLGTQMTKTARETDSASRLMRRAFVAIGGAIVVRQATRTIAEFEKSMVTLGGVAIRTSNSLAIQQRQFAALERTARQLGASTRFSATEASEGLLFLARAGFEVDEAMAAIPATLDLAQVGLLGLGRAADIASNLLSQFNLAADETIRVVDSLVIVSNRSNTNVEQLADAMKFAGPVSSALGNSLEVTAAAIGKLGDSGIQASLAGTGLRSSLLALAAPTDAAQASLNKLGLTLDDVNPEKRGLIEIFRTLGKAQLGAGDAAQIFGRRNVAVALTLARTADEVEELTRAQAENRGEANRLARAQEDTLEGATKTLISAYQELILVLGDSGVNGALRGTVAFLTDTVRVLSGARQEVDTFSVSINALAFALGAAGLAGSLSLVASGLRLTARLARAHPLFFGVAVLSGAIGAFRELSREIDEVGEALKRQRLEMEGFAISAEIAAEELRQALEAGQTVRAAAVLERQAVQQETFAVKTLGVSELPVTTTSALAGAGLQTNVLRGLLQQQLGAIRTDIVGTGGASRRALFEQLGVTQPGKRFAGDPEFPQVLQDFIDDVMKRSLDKIITAEGQELREFAVAIGDALRIPREEAIRLMNLGAAASRGEREALEGGAGGDVLSFRERFGLPDRPGATAPRGGAGPAAAVFPAMQMFFSQLPRLMKFAEMQSELEDLGRAIDEDTRILNTHVDLRERERIIIEAENIARQAGIGLRKEDLELLDRSIEQNREAREREEIRLSVEQQAQAFGQDIAASIVDPIRHAILTNDYSDLGEALVRNISASFLDAALRPVQSLISQGAASLFSEIVAPQSTHAEVVLGGPPAIPAFPFGPFQHGAIFNRGPFGLQLANGTASAGEVPEALVPLEKMKGGQLGVRMQDGKRGPQIVQHFTFHVGSPEQAKRTAHMMQQDARKKLARGAR